MSVTEGNTASKKKWLPLNKEQLSLEYRRLAHRFQMLRHWWLKSHVPFQPFFTIASARSGSNLLTEFISHVPGLRTHSEVLCPAISEGPRNPQLKPAQAVRHIRRSLQMLDSPARGCKLLLHQLADCELSIQSLETAFSGHPYTPPKYIVLYRQSLAEQYVSLKMALATNQWAVCAGGQFRRTLIKIDPENFRRYCDQIQQGYRQVLAHPAIAERGILLSYEELTHDPDACLRHGICPFLGVPACEPKSNLVKQSTRPLAEQIANYSAVAALLNGPLGRQHYALPRQLGLHRRAA